MMVNTVNYGIDIVILLYKEYSYLIGLLESIKPACVDVPHRIILIDNGTGDQKIIKEELSKTSVSYSLFTLPENRGFPGGCNYGANRGTQSHILFLNSDVILEPESVKNMYRNFSDEIVGVVGAKLLFPLDSQDQKRPAGKVQHAGIETSVRLEFNHVFVGWSADNPKVNAKCEPFAVTGACMMVRRDLFKQVGGFFEGYGLGTFEDVDLCQSIRYTGHKVIYDPLAVGYHHVGASSIKAQLGYPLDQNKQLFLLRWKDHLEWSEWARL